MSELRLLESVLIPEKGLDVDWLVYASQNYFERPTAAGATPIEKFAASYYALTHHSVSYVLNPRSLTGNADVAQLGLNRIRSAMEASLVREHGLTAAEAASQLQAFFAALDLRGSGEAKRGLPFFEDYLETFQDPVWAGYATALEKKIDELFDSANPEPPGTLFTIALEVTGDPMKSVKLLGLLLGAGVDSDRYLSYFKTRPSKELAQTLTRFSKLAKAYTDYLQFRRGDLVDRFMFPGTIESQARQHGYFWLEAYLAQKLKLAGLSDRVIQSMCTEFVARVTGTRRMVAQQVYRARWNLRFGLPLGAALGGLTEFVNEVLVQGSLDLKFAIGIGLVSGVLISRQVRPVSSLKLSGDVARDGGKTLRLAYRGAEFGIQVVQAECDAGWTGVQ